jgi:hypothetical protein
MEYTSEIFDYMRQSHITDRNVTQLRKLAVSPNPRVAELARVVLDVAEITPYKKRRLKELTRKNRELLHKLEQTGLILVHGS